VLKGNGADVAKHCIPSVSSKRYFKYHKFCVHLKILSCFIVLLLSNNYSFALGFLLHLERWIRESYHTVIHLIMT